MSLEFTRFYDDVRISLTFPSVPPGSMKDWHDFLLDVARCIHDFVPQGEQEGTSRFTPYATSHGGELKVQLFFPCASLLPFEAGGALLELLIYGIRYVFDQEKDTAWHLGVLFGDIKQLTEFFTREVRPSREKVEELLARYGYDPCIDTISKD